MKPIVLVIVGPTASGKSALAVTLAREFGGEVISADSRQVYRGLDIGSGKITVTEMQGVPHHLLDITNLYPTSDGRAREQFSVAEYQQLATEKIEEILTRGKLPIICGGTGLYVSAIVDDIVLPEVPPNPPLRAELAKVSSEVLFEKLKTLDPKRASTIDRHNPRRLVRAIEIASALGRVPRLARHDPALAPYEFIELGISLPDGILRQKIHDRLVTRLEQGLIEEVVNLHKHGVSWERLDELGLEYRYIARYLQNQLTREQMLEQLELAIWHYAKRQLTWFKRDRRIIWLPASGPKPLDQQAVDYLQEKLGAPSQAAKKRGKSANRRRDGATNLSDRKIRGDAKQ